MGRREQEQIARARRCLAGDGRPSGRQAQDGRLGSTLIDTVFADAKVEREFRRDGFVCTIEFVLPEATDGPGGES